MTPSFDLVVVGAGMVGTMVAYMVMRARPSWRVLVADRSLVASGATHYSSGLEHPYGLNPRHLDMAIRSGHVYDQLLRDVAGVPIFELPLYGITDQAHVRSRLRMYSRPGMRLGDEDDLARLVEGCPHLRPGSRDALLAGGRARYGIPARVASEVLRAATSVGARCSEGTDVVAVDAGEGGCRLRLGDGRTIVAGRVVLATGPWALRDPAAQVAAEAGVRIKKIVALHVDAVPPSTAPIVFFLDDDAYLLPQRDAGRWIFSFPSSHWDCEPEISRLHISAGDREEGVGILSRFSPGLADRCSGGRVFCDAYTPDSVPLVHDVTGTGRYLIAGACSGYGYRLAPAVALDCLAGLHGLRAEQNTPVWPFPRRQLAARE